MKHASAATVVILAILAAFAYAEEVASCLNGTWVTDKEVVLKCAKTFCTIIEHPSDPDSIGKVGLKDFIVDSTGKGAAKLIHPKKEGEYIPVEAELAGDTLTLTLRIGDVLTRSVQWKRKNPPVQSP